MQVILLEQIKKLGNVGDMVTVKGGYGRNFLIPGKKALRATKDNIAYFESKKAEIEKANKEKLAEAQKVLGKIGGTVVSLIQQAGEDGRLYGSVSAGDIARQLSEDTKEEVIRSQVVLHAPIKYIGVHDVEIDLHAEAVAVVHVNIARSGSEAKDAAAKFAKGYRVMEGPGAETEKDAAEEKGESGEGESQEVVASAETAEAGTEAAEAAEGEENKDSKEPHPAEEPVAESTAKDDKVEKSKAESKKS